VTGEWDPKFEDAVRRVVPDLPADLPLRPETDLRDHGLDSVLVVGLVIELENAYDVRFPDELLVPETCRSLDRLWTTVDTLART